MMSNSNAPFDSIFKDVLAVVDPIIWSEAKRFLRSLSAGLALSLDDIVQEGRIALMGALPHYDYDKSRGGIRSFVRRTVRNAFCALNYAARAQRRQPRTVVEDEDGTQRHVRLPVESIEASEGRIDPEDAGEGPEQLAIIGEMEERINVLRLRLLVELDDRERAVFECQALPSDEFLSWLSGQNIQRPTIEVIGWYLGLTKNEVDWSVKKIKGLFTSILEEDEYSDLLEGRDHGGKWPVIFLSGAAQDAEFTQSLFRSRRLSSWTTASALCESSGDSWRVIETYEWGAVIHLYLDEERQATLLIEGRFNHRTGEVIASAGHWKRVGQYVPWYGELAKRLASAQSTVGQQE
jgi:RNA polymerase sigma factor (sigma-70 family)